jgi:putative NADH-flavin reductase
MKIALIGATGHVGSKILNEALARGHLVTGIARHTGKLAGRVGVTPKEVDLADERGLADAVRGTQAIVVSVRHQRNDVRHAFCAAKLARIRRVLVVGGVASLEETPGVPLVDTSSLPPEIQVEEVPAAVALARVRAEKDLDWTFVSPPLMLVPGERTGRFRVGGDQLLRNEAGDSRITEEDLAVAIIDELENPQHVRERFTVGY